MYDLSNVTTCVGDTFLFLQLPSLGARWPSGLERWTGDRTVRGSNPTAENFLLRNFGNSVYPALPVSFGGDTKSRRSLLSGVYARGSKITHQSALECVTVVDSTAHSKTPPEVRLCGGKRCSALKKEDEEECFFSLNARLSDNVYRSACTAFDILLLHCYKYVLLSTM